MSGNQEAAGNGIKRDGEVRGARGVPEESGRARETLRETGRGRDCEKNERESHEKEERKGEQARERKRERKSADGKKRERGRDGQRTYRRTEGNGKRSRSKSQRLANPSSRIDCKYLKREVSRVRRGGGGGIGCGTFRWTMPDNQRDGSLPRDDGANRT